MESTFLPSESRGGDITAGKKGTNKTFVNHLSTQERKKNRPEAAEEKNTTSGTTPILGLWDLAEKAYVARD